jgi:hypothetical protein
VDTLKEACGKTPFFESTQSDGNIGINIHFVLDVAGSTKRFHKHPHHANKWGSGQANDNILSRKRQRCPKSSEMEKTKVDETRKDRTLAKQIRSDAQNANALVIVSLGQNGTLSAIDGTGGNDRHFMAAGDEVFGPIGQVLRGGNDIRPKGLIDDKNAHRGNLIDRKGRRKRAV